MKSMDGERKGAKRKRSPRARRTPVSPITRFTGSPITTSAANRPLAGANRHGDAYWLYVVERAGTDDARTVRIQDPTGQAMTFTFDCGWRAVAVDSCQSGEQG